MSIGDGCRTYSDSTLKNCKKDELIGFIRVLEENLRNAYKRLDNQAIILHNREPVKQGHWVEYPKPHYFKCSECEYIAPYRKAVSVNGEREYNYCPNCGAIMDLEG